MAGHDKETTEAKGAEREDELDPRASSNSPRSSTSSNVNESGKGEREEKSASSSRLPPHVERALERARAAARADRQRRGGRWLAIVPASVALVLLLLMMPRSTVPDAVPLPLADGRHLAQIARADDARAAEAEATRLPTGILNVGTAFRALNAAEVRGADEVEMADARRTLEVALRDLQPREGLEEDLLSLRALQERRFLDALVRWEATGETTNDVTELAGKFVQRSVDAGWVVGRRLLMSEAQRRVAFKTVWNALTGVGSWPAFELSLDEQRELYAFYLAHPHPPDSGRQLLVRQRAEARTPEACARVNAEERRESQLWRVDKIRKLAVIDRTYPASYALGVAYYQAGRYDLSAEAFTVFIGAHPDGPYTLRAKNHLKAALRAHGML